MNDRQIDMLLYAAAELMGRPELDLYNSAPDDLKGSKRFIRRMRRLVKRARRSEALAEWRGVINAAKRVVAIVLVICTVTLGCILSIEAVREVIYKYMLEWGEKWVNVEVVGVQSGVESRRIDIYKEPRELPEEFERYEIEKADYLYVVEYERITETYSYLIVYTQMPSDIGRTMAISSNESTTVRDVRIGKYDALCFTTERKTGTTYTLVWNDGIYEYILEGNVPLDELIKYAESIE